MTNKIEKEYRNYSRGIFWLTILISWVIPLIILLIRPADQKNKVGWLAFKKAIILQIIVFIICFIIWIIYLFWLVN